LNRYLTVALKFCDEFPLALCWRCPPASGRRYVDYRPELPRLPFPDPEDALDPLICPELPTVPLPVLDDEPAALDPLVWPEL